MLIAQISDFHIKARGKIAYRVVDTASCLAQAVAAVAALDPAPISSSPPATSPISAGRRNTSCCASCWRRCPVRSTSSPAITTSARQCAVPLPVMAICRPSGFLHYTVEDHPLRLVALDTVIPGEGGGRLCEERLRWLDHTLAAAPTRPTMIIMHHPPFSTGIAHMDQIGLSGAEAFAQVLVRHPQVERVLCGHLHRSIQARIGTHAIASTAPSTAHQVALDLRVDGPSRFMMEPPGLSAPSVAARDRHR